MGELFPLPPQMEPQKQTICAQLVPRDLTLEWPLPPSLAGGSPSLLPLSGYLRIVTLTALRREIIELSEEWEKMSEAAGRGGE